VTTARLATQTKRHIAMENRFDHRVAASIIRDPQLESKRRPRVLVDLTTQLKRRTQIQAAVYSPANGPLHNPVKRWTSRELPHCPGAGFWRKERDYVRTNALLIEQNRPDVVVTIRI